MKGVAIYDATNGSLRLTERLIDRFEDVVTAALELQQVEDTVVRNLKRLLTIAADLETAIASTHAGVPTADGDWTKVISRNEPAMYLHPNGPLEVIVVDYRYTPAGLMYELRNDVAGKWMVLASSIEAINGRTLMIRSTSSRARRRCSIPPGPRARARLTLALANGTGGDWNRAILKRLPSYCFELGQSPRFLPSECMLPGRLSKRPDNRTNRCLLAMRTLAQAPVSSRRSTSPSVSPGTIARGTGRCVAIRRPTHRA